MKHPTGQSHMREHLDEQRVENAHWLIDEQHEDPERVAKRLGWNNVEAMEKAMERERKRAS